MDTAPPWEGRPLVRSLTAAAIVCHDRENGSRSHLLVDRSASSTTLFTDPGTDDYREHRTLASGKPLALPEPFAFEPDTTDLL